MRLFPKLLHYLLTPLQCQPVTNVTIVVQVHINLKKKIWRDRDNRVGQTAGAVKQRLYDYDKSIDT